MHALYAITVKKSRLYPPIYDRRIAPVLWHPNYVRTYIERDVRQMLNVNDLHTFQTFVSLCAGRTGQLLNLSSLANDCGVSPNTAKAWITVLEASYIVYLLRPHHKNFDKRVIKTPKLYFYDVGLATRLLGIENKEQLRTHAYRGPLFETWVIGELLKKRYNAGQPSNLYFWRDRTGNEIDVIIDQGTRLLPVEIKSGETITESYFKGLNHWLKLAGRDAGHPFVVYGGNKKQQRSHVTVLPWQEVTKVGK